MASCVRNHGNHCTCDSRRCDKFGRRRSSHMYCLLLLPPVPSFGAPPSSIVYHMNTGTGLLQSRKGDGCICRRVEYWPWSSASSKQVSGDLKPVAHASRSLSTTEIRYAQTEEAIVISQRNSRSIWLASRSLQITNL